MFLKISTLLTIFQLIAAGSPNVYHSKESEVKAANIYDETALQNIQERLDQQQTINENLRLKIELLEMTLNQQIRKDLEEIKATLTTQKVLIDLEKANLIDIRLELNQQLTMLKNELRRDLEEVKATLTTQKESIKTMNSRKADDRENCKYSYGNLTDIRDQIIEQFKNMTKPATAIQSLPKSCAEALEKSGRNGVYKIKVPDSELEPFYAYCLKDTANMSEKHIHDVESSNNTSGWLVIQRRQDGSIDFYRNWTDYRHLFGNLEGEFFIGLEKLHALTQSTLHELWIQMEDNEGNKRWAKYSSFAIGAESDGYALNILGTYTGDAGDSLSPHAGMKWTTLDRDNDILSTGNCARDYKGGWWYIACHESNLNGQYAKVQFGEGINWFKWHGYTYSLKYVHMAIRPVQ